MAKRFQFRFDSLLQLRVQERRAAEKEVVDADQAMLILRQQATEVELQRTAARESSNLQRRSSTISVDRLLNEGRYDLQLAAQLRDLKTKVDQIGGERERRLARLRAANAEVRRLERLKERQQAEWKKNQLAAEQSALDEIATARFLRRVRDPSSVLTGNIEE